MSNTLVQQVVDKLFTENSNRKKNIQPLNLPQKAMNTYAAKTSR